jgi:hypothetical protein
MVAVKAGARLRSTTDTTEVAVVKTSSDELDLQCGGAPMVPLGTEVEVGEPKPGYDEGTLIGKRYVDADDTVEVLCTKAGPGSLSIGETVLVEKSAKPLPSSD